MKSSHSLLLTACSLALAVCLAPAKADPVTAEPRTELTAEDLVMTRSGNENHIICTGSVLLTGTNLKIACERLEIIVDNVGDKDATIGELKGFKYLLATGSVRLVQGDREATCGRAEVLPEEDKVVLSEDPVVIDRGTDTVARGTEISMFRGERKLRVKNPIFTGPPIRDLSADAAKGADVPPPPKP